MSTHMQPQAEPRTFGPDEDIREIRASHRDWWAGNFGIQLERMERNFAPDCLMFNLNGHPYFGRDEMMEIWKHYKANIEVRTPVQIWDLRIHAEGDLAYLTCEGVLPITAVTESGWGTDNIDDSTIPDVEEVPFRFRETSVLRRNDGEGGKKWVMWHFHCSPLPQEDEPRPAYDDSWTSRGSDNGGHHELTAQIPV